MKRWRQQKIVLNLLAVAFFCMGAFINCSSYSLFSNVSNVASTSSTGEAQLTADGGGGAYDGKIVFNRYDKDKCGELDSHGQPKPNAVLLVARKSSGGLTIEKVRESCQNLAVAQSLSQDAVQIIPDGSIRHEKQSYIAEKPNDIAPIGYSILSPQAQKQWGPGKCIVDGLWNADIGNGGRVVSHRFRAPVSGDLVGLRVNWADGAAAQGTGGSVRIRVFGDTGAPDHRPDLGWSIYAEAIFTPGLSSGVFTVPSDEYREVAMAPQLPLQQGQIYHVYFENIDGNEATNYIGVEAQTTGPHHGRVCRFTTPEDWGLLKSDDSASSTLVDLTKELSAPAFWAPIMQLRMADGTVFGNSNISSGNDSSMILKVTAGSPVRERISPSSAHNLTKFYVHTAAAKAGRLDWSLKLGDGTVLASGAISEANANYQVGYVTVLPNMGFFEWYEVNMPSPVMLIPGNTYNLEFSTSDGSEWAFADQLDGSDRGFTEGAAFEQSIAEHFINGNWIGVANWSPTANGTAVHWRLLFEDQ